MREFRPPIRRSIARTVLMVALSLLIVLMGAVTVLVLGMSRPTYAISNGTLAVRSGDLLSGARTIRLSDVTDTRVATLTGGRRTAGTAIPGLCAGRFSYPDLGAVWQATNCATTVLVVRARSEELPLLITPPDLAGFADAMRAGTEMAITLPPPSSGPARLIVILLGPLVVVVSALVALLGLGPHRMRYLVGDGVLEVRTLFGQKRWSAAGARAKAHTPSRLWRVAGTAAPGYYSGLYRESGRSTRVYATEIDRVLLFEGPARVLLSPEDRAGMLGALQEQGASVEHEA